MKAFRPTTDDDIAGIGPETKFAIMSAPAPSIEDVAERLAISPRQAQAHITGGSLIAVNG